MNDIYWYIPFQNWKNHPTWAIRDQRFSGSQLVKHSTRRYVIYHCRRFKLAVHDYFPIFFKVDVSTKLVLAIDTGKYSETQTIVYAIFEKIEILSTLFLGDYSIFKKKVESRNFTDAMALNLNPNFGKGHWHGILYRLPRESNFDGLTCCSSNVQAFKLQASSSG